MNKKELITAVAAKSQLSKTQAEKVVNNLFNVITTKLSEGEKIQLMGFGIFTVKTKAQRKGRNPQSGEEITIPASKNPVFTPGKILKDVVNQKTFIEDFITSGKINEVEAKVLTYIFEESSIKPDQDVEVKNIAKHLNMELNKVEEIVGLLISKKILNTMVYYGPIDSVYLRAKWRKYL